MTQQGWFLGPEPPVSRGLWRRLCMPWASGADLPPSRRLKREPAGSATALLEREGDGGVKEGKLLGGRGRGAGAEEGTRE